MGKVADLTALPLHSPVSHLLFIIFFLMALITGLFPFRLQQMTCLGGMGIMAGCTLTSFQGGMNIGLVQTYLLSGMAGITDLISFFFQQELWKQAMPEVAVLTFFLFDDQMDILHPQILIGELFVAVQTLFLHKPFPCWNGPSQGPSLWRLRTTK
jgi:hypothetical protein